MKVLMVGTGAVGQMLGMYLAKSGVDLAFYARPGSAERLRRTLDQGGLPLFQLTCLRRRRPIVHQLADYTVVTDTAGSRRFEPDQIWFAVPSPVYYSEWFGTFLRDVPSQRVVCFAPEGGRPELMPDGVPDDRLVFGGITFVAWQGDLGGGGGRPEGVNFWLPGLSIPLMGAEPACAEVREVLKTAGLRSDVKTPDYGAVQAAVTAVMTTFVAGLELASWSLRAFRSSPWRRRAARGAREAVLSQLSGAGPLTEALLGLFLSSTGFFLATLLLPLIFPIDAQAYIRFHFLKTRDQTLVLLDLFAEDADKRGIPADNIRALLQGLRDSAE